MRSTPIHLGLALGMMEGLDWSRDCAVLAMSMLRGNIGGSFTPGILIASPLQTSAKPSSHKKEAA